MKTIDRKRDLFIGGIGLGASLMYALDPRLGRRRRAIVRDKFVRISRKARQNIDTGLRDLRNRAFGLAAATRGLVYKTDGSDHVIADRVRSELGFWVSHPSSIEVSVTEGRLTLTGRILEDEVDRLLREISSLRGVKSVENRLEAHKEANSIPDLQGQPSEPMGRKLDIMQSSWSPATRLLVGTATAGSLLYGVTRRGPVGAVVALLSGATLSRALTNLEFKRLIGIGAGHRAIDIQKIINVSAPVEEVFAFWANYENFPCFMRTFEK